MLDDLRKKSPLLKQAYAFWGALLITFIIGGIWLLITTVSFSENNTLAELEEGRERAGAFAQFFGQIRDNISNSWQENKEVLKNLSDENIEKEANTGAIPTSIAATSTVSTTSTGTVILIATSSPSDIKIATTSNPTNKQND